MKVNGVFFSGFARHLVRHINFCLALAFLLLVGLGQAVAAAGSDSEEQAERALQQAESALLQQDWSQAELHLERALMFVPHHAQARLELAFLLVKRGRLAAAEVLISSLIDDGRTPEDHRVKLRALLAEFFTHNKSLDSHLPKSESASPQGVRRPDWEFLVDLYVGYASNPLGGSREDQITLTLESGDFLLAVEPQNLHAASLGFGFSAVGPSGLRLGIQGQALGEPLGRQQIGLSLVKPLMTNRSGQLQLGMSAAQGFYNEQRLTTSFGWVTQQLRVSAKFEASRNPQEQEAGVRLDWYWGSLPSLSGLAFVEVEEGLHRVPSSVRVGLLSQLLWGPKTRLSAMVWHQQDTDGYSELLKNNARRHLLQAQFNAERILWERQANARRSQVYWGFVYARRWSNLSLFQYEDWQSSIGFRTGF